MADRGPGELALVLHTHMPYVEGYGTWPSGEEWLWEAMASCYLPLLDVLGRAPLTLSLTPVLADQLQAPGIAERFLAFMRGTRRETHEEDIRGCLAGGEDRMAAELERSLADYERAAARFEQIGGDLLGALLPHVAWTSAATHAVLPLLATDAGVRLQVQTGIESHRRRRGEWEGGFWLPECAYAPWLDERLEEAGVRATCVDLTDRFGLGADEHLRPMQTEAGPLLVPVDWTLIELVWSSGGYPANGTYRDYHHHTTHHHRVWGNDGGHYDREAALALARSDAADFVRRARVRVRKGGLSVCALDTELLGHWWYEGLAWLEGVIDEADRQGLTLVALDEALTRHDPQPAPPDLGVSTWGSPRDLSTWDGPSVAGYAWRARAAELNVASAGAAAGRTVVRELLALQSSDWAFMVSRGLAGPYPAERADGHAAALEAALRNPSADGPRGLAPRAEPSLLATP
ncbi:MAG: 1,4-alpha-glucan branching protein domain-containing protein [Solirubrobacteraceae bacterium]